MVRGGETGDAVENPCHGVTLPQWATPMPEMWAWHTGRSRDARRAVDRAGLDQLGSFARWPMAQRVEVLLANCRDVLVEIADVPG